MAEQLTWSGYLGAALVAAPLLLHGRVRRINFFNLGLIFTSFSFNLDGLI
jgi:hypothetical protein